MTELLDARLQAAEKVKALKDIALPKLDLWNYDGICNTHRLMGATKPDPACDFMECGGDLHGYQRVGVTWMYLRGRGLLADDPGVGKWIEIMHLVCLLIQRGELKRRALFVVQTPSLPQCVAQTRRWAPGLKFDYASGRMSKAERVSRYSSGHWDVMMIGQHVALRDKDELAKLAPFDLFFSDDVDELLSYSNATHRAIVKLAALSHRSVVGNATNLQTKLEQLHAASLACGGVEVFGTQYRFAKRYVKQEQVPIYVKGVQRKVWRTTGYRNMNEFRDKIRPMYLRRRIEDLENVALPILLPPSVVHLDLSPAQEALYDKLKAGALKLKNQQGVTYNAAKTMFQSGQRICAGLPALGGSDGPGASPKLDWLMHRLQGVWSDRKVIAYMINRGMVEALQARAEAAGIEVALVWGEQTDLVRQRHVQRFQRDPECRLLIGSKSVERSLNLQAASVLVCIDTQLNPARMRQLIGRIRRAGSHNSHVMMVTLLMNGTQESGYLEVLRKRAALSDYVHDESAGAEIYGALSPYEMLDLIAA